METGAEWWVISPRVEEKPSTSWEQKAQAAEEYEVRGTRRSNLFFVRARRNVRRWMGFRSEGKIAAAEHQLERAIQHLDLVLATSPGNLSSHYLRLGCLLELQRFAEVKEQACQLVQMLADKNCLNFLDPAAHLALSHSARRLGQTMEAVDALQVAMDLFQALPQHCQNADGLASAQEACVADADQSCSSQMPSQQRELILACIVQCINALNEKDAVTVKSPVVQPAERPASRLRDNVFPARQQELVCDFGSPSCQRTDLTFRFRSKPFGPQGLGPVAEGCNLQLGVAAAEDIDKLLTGLLPAATAAAAHFKKEQIQRCFETTCCEHSCRLQVFDADSLTV